MLRVTFGMSFMATVLFISVEPALADCGDKGKACLEQSNQQEESCSKHCMFSNSCQERGSAQAERRIISCNSIVESCHRAEQGDSSLEALKLKAQENKERIRCFGNNC